MAKLQRAARQVEVDRADWAMNIRNYLLRLAGASLEDHATGSKTNVKLHINGEEKFAEIQTAVFDDHGHLKRVILRIEESDRVEWYVIKEPVDIDDARIEQYVLFVEENGAHELSFDGYKVI